MEFLNGLITRARSGDLEAYGGLVEATQTMVYAVARGVLRDSTLAQDAAQEAYLMAFRRLGDLQEPAAFISWLRRIVITVALNMRRARRSTLLQFDDIPDVPVLDEVETSWSERQRERLAAALLTLTSEERRLCDRRYHGHWSTSRLAQNASVAAGAISQNVYLFAAANGLATVIRAWIDRGAIADALGLTHDQHVLLSQTVGYPKH